MGYNEIAIARDAETDCHFVMKLYDVLESCGKLQLRHVFHTPTAGHIESTLNQLCISRITVLGEEINTYEFDYDVLEKLLNYNYLE